MTSHYRRKSGHSGPHGVMFHHFHDDETFYRSEGSISADELSRMIDLIGIENIISPNEWIQRAAEDALEDHHICLTFDDALRCQYEVAVPVLNNAGITAFFFVYSRAIEGHSERLELFRYLRNVCYESIDSFYDDFYATITDGPLCKLLDDGLKKFPGASYLSQYPFYSLGDRKYRFVRDHVLGVDQYNEVVDSILARKLDNLPSVAATIWMNGDHLQQLSASDHQVGLHSYSHPMQLKTLDIEVQRSEYRRNFDHLDQILTTSPRSMSHPCNSYGPETLVILNGLGIAVGFCATMQYPERCGLEFPREDHSNIMRWLR